MPRKRLTDDDLMPVGKYRQQRLGDVPRHYWQWLIGQGWIKSRYPGLIAYARRVHKVKATAK